MTRKDDFLYLIVTETAERIALTGLESRVDACVKVGTKEPLSFIQSGDWIEIPWKPAGDEISVIRLECREGLLGH